MGHKQQRFNRAFAEVMNPQTIQDIELKMKAIRNAPQEQVIALFVDMCDWGIELYIQAEQERSPEKSVEIIVKNVHQKEREVVVAIAVAHDLHFLHCLAGFCFP